MPVGRRWTLCLSTPTSGTTICTTRRCCRCCHPGLFIIADNTLWSDKILNADSAAATPQTAGIALFNDLVAADDSVEKIIIPLRDGLTIIRKEIDEFQTVSRSSWFWIRE